MKKIAITLGIIILIIIILIGGLSLYLTDERLRSWVLPEIREATGRDVEIERISYTLFQTFPRFGLVIEGLEVPDPVEDKLASVDEMLLSLNLIPLLQSEVSIQQLQIDRPEFTYIIYDDGTTNLDDFIPEDDPEEVDEPGELPDIDLAEVIVTNAAFGMDDHETETSVQLSELDLTSSLHFAEQLESTLEATLGSLDVTFEGRPMISGLAISLRQTSILDMAEEMLEIQDGQLNIRGLDLVLEGNISEWGEGEPFIDMQLASESDDFGTLLDLVPPEFEEYIEDLDTGGELELTANLNGRFTEDEAPSFEARANITEGYIQHVEVPERISDIQLTAEAVNDLFTIHTFEAIAGETRLSATGEITDPLEEDALFQFSGNMDADLSTAERYVPMEEFDIEELAGLIEMSAEASGPLWNPEDSEFDVIANLTDGLIRHTEIGRPIEDIMIALNATHEEVRIDEATARSSDNYFLASATITSPLDPDVATFDASGQVDWDLATVGEYYPIDEDTLSMRGMISLNGSGSGTFENPADADFNVDFNLTDGYFDYHELGQPIEELTASANATQRRITVSESSVRSGNNRFALSGGVIDYMEEDASFDLTLNGLLVLEEIDIYYPVEEEFGLVMDGTVDSEIRMEGSIDDLEAIQLYGPVSAENVNVDSPDLILPLTDINGNITFDGDDIETEQVSFLFGESDYYITGNLNQYKSLMYEPGEAAPAHYTGSYRAEFLNVDEFLDYEDVPEDPEPFDAWLPNLTGEVDGEVERMQFFAMEATDITGDVELNPDYVQLHNGNLSIYDGTMDGGFQWDVFAVDHTGFAFTGDLEGVRVERLFEHFDLGGRAQLPDHVRADFNATTDFYAEFDEYLEPDMMALRAEGDFGMEEARIVDHPVQVGLANLLGSDDLKDLALDQWTAIYDIEDGQMELEDFNLTSKDLGLNLSGNQDLIEDELDYRAEVVLPGEWTDRLGDRVPREGREALKRDDGKLVLPITIRGSSESPRIGFDESQIREKIEEYLRRRAEEEGRDIIDGILDRFNRN